MPRLGYKGQVERVRDQDKKDRYEKGWRMGMKELTERAKVVEITINLQGKRVVNIETRIKAICWHRK
jgi:hypothetical protein